MLRTQCQNPTPNDAFNIKAPPEIRIGTTLECQEKKTASKKSSRMLSERCFVKVVASLQTWRRQEGEYEN
jgi:hypothetical protein